MKRMIQIFIVVMALLCTGCTDTTEHTQDNKIFPVEVFQVKEEVRAQKSSYIGTVQPDRMVQLSFKTGGRIEKVLVEKGDHVKKGDVLTTIEKTDLAYAERIAKSQLDTVKAEFEKASNGATKEDIEQAKIHVVKAEDAYHFAFDRYFEVEQLFQKGSASKQAYDQAKLERDIRASDLKLAREVEAQVKNGARFEEIKALSAQLELAQTEYEYRKSQLDDAVLISNMDGIVMDVLVETGERVGSGHPVVVLRDNGKKVQVGVPEKELGKITMDTNVMVEKEGNRFQSKLIRIAEMPDTYTGLYQIEIATEPLDLPFGASVTVTFLYGEEPGIFIPITAIHSAGEDFVYTVSEGYASRKTIQIEAIDNFDARVTGLNAGDWVITSGASRISIGDAVEIKEGIYDSVD